MPRADPDRAFERVAAAFADDHRVTRGDGSRNGFGSTGLKVDGRLFALVSSRKQFVVKLPKARVGELTRDPRFEHFDPGHGRLMKEWVATFAVDARWVALAREARRFVGGD